MSASRANGTSGTGRTSSSIRMQLLGANPTGSQAASHSPPSSPIPPTASSTGRQTPSPSTALAPTPPPSTVVPPVLSRSQNPALTSSSTTPTTPQEPCRPPTPTSTSSQAPAAGTAGPQKRLYLSELWGKLRSNWKTITGFLAFAITLLGIIYAAIQFPYTKWSQRNDFRDGCINDLDHNLPMARECFEELARSRVSSVVWKRSFETVHTALTHRPELGITIDVAIGCIALGLAVISTGVTVHQARSYSRPPRDVADKDARGTASARFSEDIRNRNRPSGMGTSRYNFQKSRVTTSGLANV